MNPVVHVLRRMGGRATTLLPFSLAIGLVFQGIAAAARPLLWPLAMAPGIISAATAATFLRLDSSLALLLTLFTKFLVPFTLVSSISACGWR